MGIKNWIQGISGNTLYFPGCITKNLAKTEFENYKEIFSKLGIKFTLLSGKNFCCGSTAYNMGYKKEARKIVLKNQKIFEEKGITKIITNSPEAYYFFKEIYPTLTRDFNIEIEHATVSILKALKRKGIKWKGDNPENVYYHDPFYLGRYSKIYEEPREVLEILGANILEFDKNRENTLDIGSDSNYFLNFEEDAKKTTRQRIKSIPEKSIKIITPCVYSSILFRSVSDQSLEFSSFVLGRLRGMLK